jgi:protein-S-isoprenylcysteine O-methyltransferase Ste14
MAITQTTPESEAGRLIHQVLAHSYLTYFVAIILGLILDILYPIKFSFPLLEQLGMLMIIFGTALVFWAQRSARKGAKLRNSESEKICRDHFCVGPYVFTRLPTQYGISSMALGLAFLFGSFFMVIFSVTAFLIGKFVFVPKQERHLETKYGEAYLEYKKHVRF